MKTAGAIALGALIALGPSVEARAQANDVQEVLLPSFAVVGAIGVVTTGIAALVYASDDQAFHFGWIVAALFSGAFSVATSITLITSETPAGPPFGAGLALLSLWPVGYSIRSAVSPNPFGAPLGSATAVVPILSLEL